MTGRLVVVDHPLLLHALTAMRDRETAPPAFRAAMRRAGALLAAAALADLPLARRPIETPVGPTEAPVLAGGIVLVAILRAGVGLLDGMLDLVPEARVGHVGVYRDPATLGPVEYYLTLPGGLADAAVLVVDPMLATGGSAIRAIGRVKEAGARDVRMAALVAAPEGVRALHAAHADVPLYAGAVDERLNEHGYIVPGLGDAGDRLFGTG
jgi:uracil phosphoribosyltransferase